MKELKITPNEAGQRLDKLLCKFLNRASKNFIYKMLRKKNIILNGKKAEGSERLETGDVVKLFLSDETICKFSDSRIQKVKTALDILYEDAHVIFVNKPSGMLSQKAKRTDVSLVEYLLTYLFESGQLSAAQLKTFRPSVCNRLDRNTSGIVAAGKTLGALQQLNACFKSRSLQKYYLCLVKGKVSSSRTLRGFLKKEETYNKVSVTDVSVKKEGLEKSLYGSYIETQYTPLAFADDITLLKVHLITGKTHQIRAHLASVAHPLIGDYKYGDTSINDWYKRKFGVSSQLLHAYKLVMPYCEGELSNISEKEILAPLPHVFQKILREKGVQ